MADLLEALKATGWELLSPAEYPKGNENPFELEDEVARWGLVRRDKSRIIALEFHAFGDLGKQTRNTNDILYCSLVGTPHRLYFEKRQRPEWQENLRAFVQAINAVGPN